MFFVSSFMENFSLANMRKQSVVIVTKYHQQKKGLLRERKQTTLRHHTHQILYPRVPDSPNKFITETTEAESRAVSVKRLPFRSPVPCLGDSSFAKGLALDQSKVPMFQDFDETTWSLPNPNQCFSGAHGARLELKKKGAQLTAHHKIR